MKIHKDGEKKKTKQLPLTKMNETQSCLWLSLKNVCV